MVGSLTVSAALGLRTSVFFMGAAAVDEKGIYASWDVEKAVKQALLEISQRVILLVDHTKFKTIAPVFLTPWRPGMTLVTDAIPDDIADSLRGQGVDIVLA